jgi:3-hydroxymyristoyl/3-hydroxydecanoyl-(acyl carrier protein) dehydratase
MKFPAAARPGDLLFLHARRTGGLGGLVQFEASARVGETTVAEGQIVLNESFLK